MRTMTVFLLVCFNMALLSFGQAAGPQQLSTAEAKNHIGESATVCGKVVGGRISRWSIPDHGKPISLFLDEPESNPVFFLVTWSADPAKLQQTAEAYEGKHVCVTGKIISTRDVPNIIATKASQIQVQSEGKK